MQVQALVQLASVDRNAQLMCYGVGEHHLLYTCAYCLMLAF